MSRVSFNCTMQEGQIGSLGCGAMRQESPDGYCPDQT